MGSRYWDLLWAFHNDKLNLYPVLEILKLEIMPFYSQLSMKLHRELTSALSIKKIYLYDGIRTAELINIQLICGWSEQDKGLVSVCYIDDV